MQKVKLVQKHGSDVLQATIPKFIREHFGLKAGQEVWFDIESDRIVIYLTKPVRSPDLVVGSVKKEKEAEVQQQ